MSNIGIWVTDAMLLQAIEQYQQCIAASCRRINSHAGPLESRRRTTKRHMTGLMPTSHAFPPIWQFDVGPNALQWEGPTSQEHRRQKREQLSVSSMFNNFIGWLENTGYVDKSFIPPPSQLLGSETVSAEALAAKPVTESITIPEPVLQEPAPSSYLPEEIIKLRSSIFDLDIVDNDVLFKLTKTCRQSLRRRVERGDLSVEVLLAALEPLDMATKSRIPTDGTANKISAMIRRSILYAMVDAQKQTATLVSPDLWLAFVNKVCISNGDNHDVQLFWRLMDAIPGPLREHIPAGQIRNLTCAFVTLQANRHNLFAHWSARAARFSQALQQLSTQHQQELDDAMATFLLQQDWVSQRARRMRFSWLAVKAYNTQTSTPEFIQTLRTCVGEDSRLHGMQLWQVLAARLSATGAIDIEAYKQVMEATYTSMSQRWNSLVAAVMASGNTTTGLQELCILLTEIGEFEAVVDALTSRPMHLVRKDVIQAIASACNSHQQALHIYDTIDLKRQSNRKRPLWNWSTWTKYVEQMIKDPTLDPIRTWQVLNLTYRHSQQQDTPEEIKAKTQLLDKMGQWFVEAKHLNDRQVLRNVEKCATHQRVLTNGVSSQTLASMTEIITRDLKNGQRGRTSRMQWLLSMVAQNQGRDQARRTASALNGWRMQIERDRDGSL